MASASHPHAQELRREATRLFTAAIEAVQPARLVRQALHRRRDRAFVDYGGITHPLELPVTVVGAGKAAASMALACEQELGADNVRGEIITPDGVNAPLCSIGVRHARHPLPDERGVAATRAVLGCVTAAGASPVLCLISGGASSLLVAPRPPLTLTDKVKANRLLLECGANIVELNTVRKHLSQVKGGGLLRHARGPVISLLISDVVGDDAATIGSGPTVPDPTTFEDAHAILQRYRLEDSLPAAVLDLIRAGCRGQVEETVKPESADAGRGDFAIIGSNLAALQGSAAAARSSGWDVVILPNPIEGDTGAAALAFAADLKHLMPSENQRRCVLAGGETTVRVTGSGRGGRNQEFALALSEHLSGTPAVVLSAGTDGVDGPTDAAGAFVDGHTGERALGLGLSREAALAANDSYTFFERLGDLLVCGPTGTNVMDIKIALLTPA